MFCLQLHPVQQGRRSRELLIREEPLGLFRQEDGVRRRGDGSLFQRMGRGGRHEGGGRRGPIEIPLSDIKVGFKVSDRDPPPREALYVRDDGASGGRSRGSGRLQMPFSVSVAQTNTSKILNRSRHPWPGRLLIASLTGGSTGEFGAKWIAVSLKGDRRIGEGRCWRLGRVNDPPRKDACRGKPPPLFGIKEKKSCVGVGE